MFIFFNIICLGIENYIVMEMFGWLVGSVQYDINWMNSIFILICINKINFVFIYSLQQNYCIHWRKSRKCLVIVIVGTIFIMDCDKFVREKNFLVNHFILFCYFFLLILFNKFNNVLLRHILVVIW